MWKFHQIGLRNIYYAKEFHSVTYCEADKGVQKSDAHFILLFYFIIKLTKNL